jgi:NADP-dependent aldehyde dehydrogenase
MTGRTVEREVEQAVDTAVAAACASSLLVEGTSAAIRAQWASSVASALQAVEDQIVDVAAAETHLTDDRLRGELLRTVNQWRLLGEWGVALHAPTTDTMVLPGSDPVNVALHHVPLGVVGVFAASNFPLAFGAPGGDTASAVMAGCSVVVKPHPASPRTGALAIRAVREGLVAAGAPADLVVALPHDDHHHLRGLALASHPRVAALGFTGSIAGGRALMDVAAARPVPIPVYAEMGSVNPLVITLAAAETRGADIAAVVANAVTTGVGQFCTKPGVVLLPPGAAGDDFVAHMRRALDGVQPARMLTSCMADRYVAAIQLWRSSEGVGAHGDVVEPS